MKLKSARTRMFRNILDSTSVIFDESVTAIVGKNESGKSSFLTALARLNPARLVGAFESHSDYPAWLEKKHRQAGHDLDAVRPVEAVFVVTDTDTNAWNRQFGAGVLEATEIVAWRTYGGEYLVAGHQASEQLGVAHVLTVAGLDQSNAPIAAAASTFDDLQDALPPMKASGEPASVDAAGRLEAVLKSYLKGKTFQEVILSSISVRIPRFFYFANYSSLPKQIKIRDILAKAKDKKTPLDDDEQTAVSLLRQAASDDEYILNADYELRKRELENVANSITDDVLAYWTQNPYLRVLIDITQIVEAQAEPPKQTVVLDELKVRVWDDRHRLSLGFGGRSTGFQWFFSFLAAFSEYESSTEPLVILLDEPALGLHARAQSDFLRFIDDRLAPKHQVVYTTHSPFMVPPGKLERVRVVEDAGRDKGSVVSSNVLASDPDTLFPLQSALGYDLAQHLFVAPHNLVVEGISDFIYLTAISDYLASNGRVSLDRRWSVVPVGGADLVPTFVALLGHHLDVTVLVDSQKAGHQKLNKIVENGLLHKKRVLTVGGVLQCGLADIEDAFDIDDYLSLYNGAFNATLKVSDLNGGDPVVSRIARHLGVERYDHGKPADYFLRNKTTVLPSLKAATLDQFEHLLVAVNATLPS